MNLFQKLSTGQRLLLAFTISYILGFTVYFLLEKNYEFIFYVFVVLFFLALVVVTLKRSNLDMLSLWGLSIWGLLHMAGGGIHVSGSVLYNLVLIPITELNGNAILRYDQMVHFFGFAVATYVLYRLLLPYLNERANWKVIFAILVAGGMGLGALNEIIEFTATVIVPHTNVGGYTNTALDLISNTLGAIASVVVIRIISGRDKRKLLK